MTSNIVAPGAILVEAVKDLLTEIAPARGWGETWEQIEQDATNELVPNDIERLGRPDEIASAVAFLASPCPATSAAPTSESTAATSATSPDARTHRRTRSAVSARTRAGQGLSRWHRRRQHQARTCHYRRHGQP
ncbi:hypothetical protein GCM10027614_04170 [Micromonospora vulcania]